MAQVIASDHQSRPVNTGLFAIEVTVPCIELRCLCEFFPSNLETFYHQLSVFYTACITGKKPKEISLSSLRGQLELNINSSDDVRFIHAGFLICPDIEAGSKLQAGIFIDQSYFPGLLSGLKEIIEMDSD